MKSHGALPATPNVRSYRIAGRPTHTRNVSEGSAVSVCAAAVPKRYPAYGTGTPYRSAFVAHATAPTAAKAAAARPKVARPAAHANTRRTSATRPSRGVMKSVAPHSAPARSGRRTGAVKSQRYAVTRAAAPSTLG